MSILSKKNKSIANWKCKAVERGAHIRYLRKECNRVKQNLKKSKNKIKMLEKQLEEMSRKLNPVRSKEEEVKIALTLLVNCALSYSAVSRVMKALSEELGVRKAPCVQTIINWNIRLSMAKVYNAADQIFSRFGGNYFLVIDSTICLGSLKIFAALAIRSDQYGQHGAAPGLQDTLCVGIATAATWTGDSIANLLTKVINALGAPQAIIKDGGSDLAKATRILDARGCKISCIDDISHFCANLLKRQYGDHPQLKVFLSACGKISASFKQTILACLAPPKVTVKSRFMNLHRLVRWADQLLKHSPKGGAKKGSILAKLREKLGELPECKGFIKLFLRDAGALLACQEVLKNKGLSKDTHQECKEILKAIPQASPVRRDFMEWLNEHLEKARKLQLEDTGMLITSDIIESFFGRIKTRGTGTMKDANRLALFAPGICDGITDNDAWSVLEISTREQQELVGHLPSVIKQRRQILPNPGSLNQLESANEISSGMELICRAKKQAKNQEKDFNSSCYENGCGPRELAKKPIKLMEEIGSVEVVDGQDGFIPQQDLLDREAA